MKLISLKRIAEIIEGVLEGESAETSKVAIDSRQVNAGDLFFALKGNTVNGHDFIQEAALRKASGAVVSRNYSGGSFGIPLIRVDDTLIALQELASILVRQAKPLIIAITGSLGKTTTKDFITTLLRTRYCVISTTGNNNSQVGLPLSILNGMTGQEEILVLEMGMTHPGQIAKLVSLFPPDIALITAVTLVHACNFDSLEQIALAKLEVFSNPNTRLAIVDREIPGFKDVAFQGETRKISFSMKESSADYFLTLDNEKIKIRRPNENISLNKLSLPGTHNLHNFLAAATVVKELGLSWDEIAEGMKLLVLPERRLQQVEKNGILFINDSYNANVLSLKGALQSLPEPKPGGKKIAVIGEMLELGKFSSKCHLEVGEEALKTVDMVLCLGKECEPIWKLWNKEGRPVEWYTERSLLVESLRKIVKQGDVVLLKGSRAKGLWNVLTEI